MTDSILVVGAGIAGLTAALDCAAGGARVTLIEREAVAGGRLAAPLAAAGGLGDRAAGASAPLLASIAENERIELKTLATLESTGGGPGNFDVVLRERARFVTDDCTRCRLCHTACPVVLNNAFDADLTFRKAIYTPLAETLPEAYVIDIDNCLNTPPNYLPCNRCVEVCDDDAIRFDQALENRLDRHVGAIVLAPGFRLTDSARYAELGYGEHPDILSSAELQRMMESPGPSGGYAMRPSNEEYPSSALLVIDNLSPFALYIAASQTRQLLAQDVETVALLVLAQPGGDDLVADAEQFAATAGIKLRWGTMFRAEAGAGDAVRVSFENLKTRRYTQASFELVVLCTDVEPADDLPALAAAAGIELDDHGYLQVAGADADAVATSRPGVFAAGCGTGPRDIPASIAQAKAAAAAALATLDPRLLDEETTSAAGDGDEELAHAASDPEMQRRLEQLLNALIDRPSA